MKKTIALIVSFITVLQLFIPLCVSAAEADPNIERIVADDMVWFPGYHGKYVTEVDENGESHTYFKYSGFGSELLYDPHITIKVYKKNYAFGASNVTFYGEDEFELITDQSYDNPWTKGNTYTAQIVYKGHSCNVNITIKDPVYFEYEIRDGGAYVTGWGDDTNNLYVMDIVVPEELGGYPVVGIDRIPLRAHRIDSLWVSDTVETISYKALEMLDNVKTIHLGSSVKDIDAGAFVGMEYLSEFTVSKDSPYLTVVDGVLYSKDMKKFIAYPEAKGSTYTLDGRATDLLNTVYYEDVTFKSVNALELVTEGTVKYTADKKVLISCSGYRGSYVMPDTVEQILPEAFKEAGGLTSVVVSKNVKEITVGAFENNYYLEKVTLPEGLEAIGKSAFANCNKLESVNFPKSLEVIFEDAFKATALTGINISDKVRYVGDNAFNQTNATEIIIGNGVTEIGDYAFANNANAVTAELPKSVEIIGEYAFSDCTALKSIAIPDKTTTVKKGAFANCAALEYAPIGKNQTDIAPALFSGCAKITKVELREGITSIGDSAFEFCAALESINIPDSVTFVGSGAFYECRALKNAPISKNQTNISKQEFGTCTSIESVVIPDIITEIGDRAFWYCSSLKAVAMTNSVKYIGYDALNDCSNLKVIYFGGTAEEWENISKSSAGIAKDVSIIYFDREKEVPVEVDGELRLITLGDVDLDRDITAMDSLSLKKYCAGIYSEDDICIEAADVYNDGKINAKDLLVIKKLLAA